MTQTIVLLSGGQDSTTCLAWARNELGPGIRTVAFDYGQRHKVELEQAEWIAARMEGVISHAELPVEALKYLGGAALTNPDIEIEGVASEESLNAHAHSRGLPSTFVPGRNMLFLTLAAAYGARFGIYDLVTGVCEQDRAGYPDCRAEFIEAAETALSLALDEQVTIYAPLLKRNKAETFALAHQYGMLDVIVDHTHTCYNGVHDEEHKHDWGYGCGECPACVEREKGWIGFQQAGAAL